QLCESAASTALSNRDSTNTRLNQLLHPSASDLQAAQGKVATAQSNLNSEKTNLDQLLNPTAAALSGAQEVVSDAHSTLSAAQVNVNNAISDGLAAATIDSTLRQSWETLLAARLREQANAAILLNPALSSTFSQDELDAVQQSILSDQQRIAEQMAEITSASVIPEDVNSAMLAENSAQTALETGQEELKELQNPNQNVIAVATNDVAVEQAALDSALAELDELQNADENTITLAQNEVAKARAALELAETNLAELQHPSTTSIALAQADVDSAQASLDAATANLALLNDPKQADLASAGALVAAARESYAMTQPPLSEYALEVAQSAVDKAQAQVDSAAQQVEELKVLAPFDGVVTRRLLAPGAMASPQVPVATVASSQVVVTLRVEETTVNSLSSGQSVVFTSPGLPGRKLDLVVDKIAPAGDEQSFTFLVMLSPTSSHPELKAGMSGQVAITARLEDAVLVPRAALLRQSGRPALFVVEDNIARLKLVGIGLTDENNVEIRTGIKPGDQVVVCWD
ncbi:MAG: efflux RND transporter periplasmic adaptor subunit, partial [Chloroflexi bacterium]|nr:efflux RND transporter periplasmic adaptor subunit [Chloroflexota bacterium]